MGIGGACAAISSPMAKGAWSAPKRTCCATRLFKWRPPTCVVSLVVCHAQAEHGRVHVYVLDALYLVYAELLVVVARLQLQQHVMNILAVSAAAQGATDTRCRPSLAQHVYASHEQAGECSSPCKVLTGYAYNSYPKFWNANCCARILPLSATHLCDQRGAVLLAVREMRGRGHDHDRHIVDASGHTVARKTRRDRPRRCTMRAICAIVGIAMVTQQCRIIFFSFSSQYG
jgi:hypothetical protein